MAYFDCQIVQGGGGTGADLIVTCSSSFAGATISCTNGVDTFTQQCPSSSPYEVVFESIPTGTWTISGQVSGQTFSTIKTITDFTAELADIPDGSTVTPTDVIQTWLNCANIWDKAYTTINQVLADSTTLLALISSNNAVDYMARSTTWASAVCANSSAMTKIGANDYCANKLLANTTWLNAIVNSSYFESVLNVKIPTMTSDTTPSGVASASSVYSGQYGAYPAYGAFDNGANGWYPSTYTNQWLKYKFSSPMMAKAVTVRGENTVMYNIVLQGSNDDSTYEVVSDTFNSDVTKKALPLTNKKYLYYRFNVGTFDGQGSGMNAQLYGRA